MANLGDLFAAAAGHPINRPALDAFVANGQAMAGLRTAETNAALLKAQQAVEQEDARQRVAGQLINMKDAQGNPMYTPSQGGALADLMAAGYGNYAQAGTGLGDAFQLEQREALANPQNIGTPTDTAASAAITGKAPALVEKVPTEFMPTPGVATPPPVQQSPLGSAQTGAQNANATLHAAEAANPQAFGHGFATMTPEQTDRLKVLEAQGVIDPAHMYTFARNPSLIDATFLANQGDPTGIAGLNGAKQGVMRDYTSGMDHQTLQRASTALGHLAMMPQLITALGNGDVRGLNAMLQGLNLQTGATAPVAFDTVKDFLAKEMTTAVQGSRTALADRTQVNDLFSKAGSPQQLATIVQELTPILGKRVESSEQGFVGTMSLGQPGSEWKFRNEFRSRFLTPQARQMLGMGIMGAAPQAAAPAPGAMVEPGTAAPGAAPSGAVPTDLKAAIMAELAKRGAQ